MADEAQSWHVNIVQRPEDNSSSLNFAMGENATDLADSSVLSVCVDLFIFYF